MNKTINYQDIGECKNNIAGFRKYRTIAYGLLASSFFIGFFHRFSPATFAGVIADDLNITATALGAIASMHFWVYTLMQMPAGVLVDRLGTRLSVFAGTLLTGAGAFILSQATGFEMALAGPALVGLGISTVFVGIMKNNIYWFDARYYGVITGITMLIGTAGSVMAEGPAAQLLNWFSWRDIFLTVSVITLVVSVLTGLFLYNSPAELHEGRGTHVVRPSPDQRGIRLAVLGDRQIWCLLLCTAGTNGTFYAFAGLWGVPLLTDGFGIPNTTAVYFTTLALMVYGVGSLMTGLVSDKFGKRKPFIVFSSLIALLTWGALAVLPWAPDGSGWLLYSLLGLSGAQVVVAFSAVKESVSTENAGFSLALVNTGVFLVSAIVQFAMGALLDLFSAPGSQPAHYSLSDYRLALWLPLIISLVGFMAAVYSREPALINIRDNKAVQAPT